MGKNKNKKSKSHLLHLTHQMHQHSQSSNGASTALHPHSSSPITAPHVSVNKIDDTHKYDKQFNHVLPDLKYFGVMVVMMIVILGVVYYLDSSNDFVLTTGKKIYTLLHLS